jgi:hypothetical protein
VEVEKERNEEEGCGETETNAKENKDDEEEVVVEEE